MFAAAFIVSALAVTAGARKTDAKDFEVAVQRTEAPNGLIILLSPDPGVATVAVDLTFRAGTLYEPPNRAGSAHLVEHLMLRGSTPDTDYLAILERRGAQLVNAYTTAHAMTFRVVVPRAELPLALWVASDRLISVPPLISTSDLAREKRVIAAERAQRFLDLAYAESEMQISENLYPGGHALRGGVLGVPTELEQTSLEEVRAFVSRYLVPANAVLTITGAFDARVAHEWISKTLGLLPSGEKAVPPQVAGHAPKLLIAKISETISRRPRVTMAWRIRTGDLAARFADSLSFGAALLEASTSGRFGTEVHAELVEYPNGESLFRLDAVLPYEKSPEAAQDEAVATMRDLTRKPFSPDLVEAALVSRDLAVLFALDVPAARASLLTELELSGRDPTKVASYLDRLWSAQPAVIQADARALLGEPNIVAHAIPTRPRQPRLSYFERKWKEAKEDDDE